MRRRFQNLHGPSRSSVALGAAFITLILAAIFPYVYPDARLGMECTDLASPDKTDEQVAEHIWIFTEGTGKHLTSLDLCLEVINDPLQLRIDCLLSQNSKASHKRHTSVDHC